MSLTEIMENVDKQMKEKQEREAKAGIDRRQQNDRRLQAVPVAFERRQADRRSGLDRRGSQR